MHRSYSFLLPAIFFILALTAPALAQSNAEDAHTYMVRGMAAVEMAKSNEELAAAVEEFMKATEIAPNLAPAWYNLGLAQAKIGRLKEAIASYRKYVALAPKANDIQKVKDEIIKLEYRLEQVEKFTALSGRWVSPDGHLDADIFADQGKLTIKMNNAIPLVHSTDASIYDEPIPSSNAAPSVYDLKYFTLHLNLRGSRLGGTLEVQAIPPYMPNACGLPLTTGPAEGTLENGRIVLKSQVTTFKVAMNSNDTLFSDPKVHCDEVTPTGTMPVELVLIGPLGKGGIGVGVSRSPSDGLTIIEVKAGSPADQAGLRKGDEIIAVDGSELSLMKGYGEKLMKLRGEPGSTVQLTVKRVPGKPDAAASTAKEETLTVSVRRADISTGK